jgi:hypothetical protein
MMKRRSIYFDLLLFFVVFFILAYFIKGNSSVEFKETIFYGFLVISTFIFGIIIAFSIANRHTRLSSIRESLRRQDAVLLDIYLLSKGLGKSFSNKIRQKIDELLVLQIDFKLIDFSNKNIEKIKEAYSLVESERDGNDLHDDLLKKLLENLSDLLKIHKEVSHQVKNRMMSYEWLTSIILGAIILFCLFYINNNSILSVLAVSFISASLILLLLVLRDLNSLEWQEQEWIWEPLSDLFTELDLIPYFPAEIFKQRRVKIEGIKGLSKARLAYYPKPYPNMEGKTIKIVALKEKRA